MVSAVLPRVSFDDRSIALETPKGVEHRFFLSKDTLYTSSTKGFFWSTKTCELTTSNSSIAKVVCAIRDFITAFWNRLPGVFDRCDHWALRTLNVAAKLFVFSTVFAVGGWVNTVLTVIEVVALSWGMKALARAQWSQYFPTDVVKVAKGIAAGMAAWIPAIIALTSIDKVITAAFDRVGVSELPAQEAVRLIQDPRVGLAAGIYASIGAPLIEECLFRGAVRDALMPKPDKSLKGRLVGMRDYVLRKKDPVLSSQRILVVLKTSAVFGLMQASPAQGLANIPIVLGTGLLGLVAGILRELTGNLWAPTALNATHNTWCTLRLWNILPPLPFIG